MEKNYTTTILLITILFVFLSPIHSFSQDIPNIIPPSPQTRELNKYIDFPVDYSTGIPEISIPLYVIKTRGLDIPITLNYHASGIKEGQDDGEVGVGWSLSCNYRVSRTIYGHPDSEDIEMNPLNYLVTADGLTGLDKDNYLGRFINKPIPDEHMPPTSGTLLDGEYDQFHYSIPGQGSMFIISNRYNKTISEVTPTHNQFDYLEGTASNNVSAGIIGFRMKDDNQNVYSFGEQIDKLGFQVLETHNDPLDIRNVTAWALTDIDTKYGEKIKFAYHNKDITGKYKKQLTLSLREADVYDTYHWEYNANEESISNSYKIFALSSITTPNERIEFIEQSGSAYDRKIQHIKVYDVSDNSLVRQIDLFYRSLHISQTSYVFLDSIKIYGSDLSDYQKYSFNYYDEDDYSPYFLTNNTLVPDQWGNIKVESGLKQLLHEELGDDHAMPNGSSYDVVRIRPGDILKFRFPSYFTDRTYNITPELFTLQSIAYPTGGKTVYEYEPNRTNLNQQWGGIRIKSIKHYDANQQTVRLRRDYSYYKGAPVYPVSHENFRREYVQIETPMAGIYVRRRAAVYSSRPLGDLPNSSEIYYGKVTEHFYNVHGPDNGKIVYHYSDVNRISDEAYPISLYENDIHMNSYHEGPRHVSTYRYWKKPLLVQKAYYSSLDVLQKKEVYAYHSNFTMFEGLKVRPSAQMHPDFSVNFHFNTYFSSFYNYGRYTFETGKSLLTEKKEILYTDGDSVSTVTSYLYNDLNQVIKETTVDSKGQLLETNNVYPADKPYVSQNIEMLQANDVNKVLERSVKRDNALIRKVNYEYSKLPGDIFVPHKIKQLNKVSQLQEDKILYHQYDGKGNILSLSKANDVIINYLWSYKGQFPIAEIKGPNYDVIENILGATAIEQFSLLPQPDKADIDNFLAPLVSAVEARTLPHTEIASFSYDPLIGLTSQTDARGKTVYYDYDAFGRMKAVKNDTQSIEKKIEYHYRNH